MMICQDDAFDHEDDENQDSDSVMQPSKKQKRTPMASIENVRLHQQFDYRLYGVYIIMQYKHHTSN